MENKVNVKQELVLGKDQLNQNMFNQTDKEKQKYTNY